MAVDTITKRASALSFGRLYRLVPPDGTIDAADRKTVANSYGGIASEPPVAPTGFRNMRRKAVKSRLVRG